MISLRCILSVLQVMVLGTFPTNATEIRSASEVVVHDPKRAEFNWMMNCQGCHGVKGEGNPGGAPPMPGTLTRFLEVEGGRAYLARVPGVMYAPLKDDELADLLNWMLLRFSCGTLPSTFTAYAEDEIPEYRRDVLVTDAHLVRESLIEKFDQANNNECK